MSYGVTAFVKAMSRLKLFLYLSPADFQKIKSTGYGALLNNLYFVSTQFKKVSDKKLPRKKMKLRLKFDKLGLRSARHTNSTRVARWLQLKSAKLCLKKGNILDFAT